MDLLPMPRALEHSRQTESQAMTTLSESRGAERADSKAFPFRTRRRGGARYKGALAAVAAVALVGYAGVAVEAALQSIEPGRYEEHVSRYPPVEAAFEPVGPERVALVIGNGDYVRIDSDSSALTDAAGVGAALERLGFGVRYLEDAGYVDMLQGLLEFSRAAQSARAAVVFYAGHGHVVDGRNFMIPVDASHAVLNAVFEGDLDSDLYVTEGSLGWIPVTWLIRSVAGASHLRLVVLDADVTAPLGPVGETTVAQAAVVGTMAWAGDADAHSPYTEALLRYLEEPELELGMLFRKVRDDVMQATGGNQEPVVYGLPGWGVFLGSLSGQPPVLDPDLDPPPPDPAGEAQRVDPPGTTFRDCGECPEMVVVPEGSFMMGSTAGGDAERPVHRVTFARPFAVGVYEVTFAEWDACVSDGGCGGYRPDDAGWGHGRRPVIHVSWENAKAYVRWLSGKTGEAYRLLSESEWEYVARAGTGTEYWWGDEIGRNRANCDGCGSRWDAERTAPGSFSPNAFGLQDVHGNVWEWVEDCWNDSYNGAPSDGSAWESGEWECGARVLRGGSWDSIPRDLRSANRGWNPPDGRVADRGFRVARTLTP